MAGIVGVGSRSIIDRPRLTRLLDESEAGTILLVAPAGYGKTTLAEQWLATRRYGWFRGASSLGDVVAFALRLAEAAGAVIPDAPSRIADALRRIPESGIAVARICDVIARELQPWPVDAWIGIDDYHLAAGDTTDSLIEHLLVSSEIRILATSRERPSWATARRLLYGEIYELGQARLAMTEEEATAVLGDQRATAAGGLVAVADGWPAVIGLAAAAGATTPAEESLPETLYRYFAEELLLRAAPNSRAQFAVSSVAPNLTQGVAEALVGADASHFLDEGLHLGVLVSRADGSFEMNPLVRAFLQRKFSDLDDCDRNDATRRVFDHYLEARSWDEAFELIENSRAITLIPRLLEASIDDVLAAGRVATIEYWCDFARAHGFRAPIMDFADAEVTFRRGLYGKSCALAGEAARRLTTEHVFVARAHLRAGHAAYFLDRHADALKYFEQARAASRDESTLRQAVWGSFVAATDLEREDAPSFLRAYEELPGRTIDDVVRLATGRLAYAHRQRGLLQALDDAQTALHLVERVDDPMIRTSFWNAYGGGLLLSAKYEAAIEAAERGSAEAAEYGLDFVLPYASLIKAQAQLGLRQARRASRLLTDVAADARQRGDGFLAINTRTLYARLAVATGNATDALAMTEPLDARSSPATTGERLAVRALAFVIASELESARDTAEQTRLATTTAASRALASLVVALSHIEDPSAGQGDLENAVAEVAAQGHFDMLVLAYRASPHVVAAMIRVLEADQVRTLLRSAHDDDLGLSLGLVSEPSPHQLAAILSPREQEVSRLLAEGRTNAEIAEVLFISDVTAKVHVRHILAKLGVRNRAAAAALLAKELNGDP